MLETGNKTQHHENQQILYKKNSRNPLGQAYGTQGWPEPFQGQTEWLNALGQAPCSYYITHLA